MRPTIITRYANRKLYHTTKHQYVTLAEIIGMIRNLEYLVVIDYATKKDVTARILATAIVKTVDHRHLGALEKFIWEQL